MELCHTRGKHTVVVASMAGSQVIHELAAITHVEIAAWMTVSGKKLNSFERQCLRSMDSTYLAAVNNGKQRARSGQGVGEYCQNKSIEECRKQFGAALEQICSTCPS